MERFGTDACPACGAELSAWALLKTTHRRVRCDHCGTSLIVSGVRSAIIFDCLIAYPIVVLASLGFGNGSLVGSIILLIALSLAGTYLSIKMFYRLHYTKKKTPVKES
jgi:hypothetical protein